MTLPRKGGTKGSNKQHATKLPPVYTVGITTRRIPQVEMVDDYSGVPDLDPIRSPAVKLAKSLGPARLTHLR